MSSFEQIHAAIVEKSEMVSQLEHRVAIFVDHPLKATNSNLQVWFWFLTFWPQTQY